jgi:hypothetical protein
VVINFSYGMQAGPKDGWHDFEAALRGFIEARRAEGKQVRVVMPVGNDNTDRCAASRVLGKAGEKDPQTYFDAEETLDLPWRILPADGTSNFVEIWSGSLSRNDATNALANLALDVTPPGQGRLAVGTLGDGTFHDLGDYARVYSRIKRGAADSYRIALLVCVGPTLEYGNTLPEAPAGKWTIRIKYSQPVATDFSLFIQSDQSAVKGSKSGRRSYFDHSAYRVYDSSGRLADTFHVEPGVTPVSNDDYATYGPVQRHSTHNAISSLGMEEVLCIAGYDDLTGYPAVYSSTADGDKSRLGGRNAPSVSLPSENADSLFGLLASGSRDGSRAFYRGTSMAAALASRAIVEAILAHTGQGGLLPGTESWLRARAEAEEQKPRTDHWDQPSNWPDKVPQKSGAGRLPAPDRPDRIGRLV